MAFDVIGVSKKIKEKPPSPQSIPDARIHLLAQTRLCAYWGWTGERRVMPKPVATGGGGR
jgi:hypothetical protein